MSLIAIFSDVHGNLPALRAVLSDIDKRNADQVYCLGDLVDFAPWPNEIIDLLRSLHIPCLMGNHDERVAFDKDIIRLAKHSHEESEARLAAINYTKSTITTSSKNYLANLPKQIVLTFSIKARDINIQLVHASTRSNDEYIYENHDLEDIRNMLNQQRADILVMGHTHESYIRRIPSKDNEHENLIINCGSVGRSKQERQLTNYVLLKVEERSIEAEIIKLAYPVEETVKGILESGIPDFYAQFLIS